MANKQYDFDESLARIDALQNQEVLQSEIPLYDLLSAETMQMACSFATVIAVKFLLPKDKEDVAKLRCKTTVLSEATAILMSDPSCIHVFYEEDTVIAVLNTPKKADIDSSLETVAKLNVLQNVFNIKFNASDSNKVTFGIGMVYGEVQFIPVPSNEKYNFLFDGEAIVNAVSYADQGLKPGQEENIVASFTIFNNLKEDYKKFFTENKDENIYTCSVINTHMNQWVLENKQ